MNFKKYQHLERFGTTEVDRIELGTCYIFPKIDGTNASVWLGDDRQLQAGSRTRRLLLDADNAGFFAWAKEQHNLIDYLKENPTHRLFGEWLVPHALKTYRNDAWRKFYVFDVSVNESLHEEEDSFKYLPYEMYSKKLEEKGIDFITPICSITNASYEQLINQLEKNVFLIEDGKGAGEGIVIKNYDFKNKYGRTTFAKIVTTEFKEKHAKVHGTSELKGKSMVEAQIADDFVTTALCEKVLAKIENEGGFTSRKIPQLLNTIYYDIVNEDAWNFVKKHKNPTVNFSTLQHLVFAKVKEKMPQLF
jgi:hypothetical protein